MLRLVETIELMKKIVGWHSKKVKKVLFSYLKIKMFRKFKKKSYSMKIDGKFVICTVLTSKTKIEKNILLNFNFWQVCKKHVFFF